MKRPPFIIAVISLLLCGVYRASIVQAAPGDVDLTFDPGSGLNLRVKAVALQPDGKIIIGGDFASVRGAPRNRIARLNPDGTADTTFDPGLGANDNVEA